MKKILIAAITASFGITGIASASSDGSNAVSGRLTGNTSANYFDPFFGDFVSCNETQHRKFDTVSCTLTTPRLDLAGTTNTIQWFSDFDGTLGLITYTVSADGTTYSGKATY